MHVRLRRLVCSVAAVVAAAALPATAQAARTAVKVIQTVDPQFPLSLEFTPISTGLVEMVLKIDTRGRLTDLLVTGYTHKAFAEEAKTTVKKWEFKPALEDSIPVVSRLKLNLKFTARARVVVVMPSETPSVLLRQRGVSENISIVCAPDELDRPLEVLHPTTPVHPGRKIVDLASGHTVLDFYVDETGRARMPLVVETTHPAFSTAALDALADWKFAVPRYRGRPAIVRMQQTFNFTDGT